MSEPPVHTTVDEVHAHAHQTGHRWIDMIIAVSAITISVISLFVAIEHGKTEEKLVAANSWPFLVYESAQNGITNGSRLVELKLHNGGVGPARVQSVKVELDGRVIHNHTELMSRCCGVVSGTLPEEIRLGLLSKNSPLGILPAREGVELLTWRERPGNQTVWEGLNRARTRLRFQVCYCSVLDECWISDVTPTAHPKAIAECRTSPDNYAG